MLQMILHQCRTMGDDITVDWDILGDDVLSLQTDIPQANRFLGSRIFVRECYSDYYGMVMELLQSYRMVSVTGTPGIGKSVFGLYFFHRYRLVNPTEKVLVASFSMNHQLEDCILYPALKDEEMERPQLFTRIPGDVCKLYLYDGPPNDMPPGDSKMVTFVPPDPFWLDKVASNYPDHAEIYMPNWSFLEQQSANGVLGLNLSTTDLRHRHALFGGTARYVLSTDARYVDKGAQLVFKALNSIKTLEDIQDMFNDNSSTLPISNKIMHYFPSEDRSMATIKPASKYISMEMANNVWLKKNAGPMLHSMLESIR